MSCVQGNAVGFVNHHTTDGCARIRQITGGFGLALNYHVFADFFQN
ncbi:hypothetical protein [Neisseria iguanae]|nr:hypothetical protein [Neisseria iguanae]